MDHMFTAEPITGKGRSVFVNLPVGVGGGTGQAGSRAGQGLGGMDP